MPDDPSPTAISQPLPPVVEAPGERARGVGALRCARDLLLPGLYCEIANIHQMLSNAAVEIQADEGGMFAIINGTRTQLAASMDELRRDTRFADRLRNAILDALKAPDGTHNHRRNAPGVDAANVESVTPEMITAGMPHAEKIFAARLAAGRCLDDNEAFPLIAAFYFAMRRAALTNA